MRYLKAKFVLLSLFITGAVLGQQSNVLKGRVAFKGNALEFVNVGLQGTKWGGATDANGAYSITGIKTGDYVLKVSSIGFRTYAENISIKEGSNVINIEMEETAMDLDEVVVVSGTMKEVSKLESPVPVEVYRPAFFTKNPTPNIYDALQNVNGVRPQLNCNICNTGDIHINGLEGPYTMVLLDGMPIVSGLSTVYGLSGIPNSLVERIEIVKGPASSLYGSEAVGGLVNIITKNPDRAPLATVDVFGTSWGELTADIGAKWRAGKKADALVGLNYHNFQHTIDKNGDNFTDMTLQHRVSLFNKWVFHRQHQRPASLALRYYYEDRWGGEMDWNPSFRGGDQVYGESIYTQRVELVGAYRLPLEENITLQYSFNDHDQNSVYGDLSFQADQRIAFTQLVWDKTYDRHSALFGLTYRYTFYDDNTAATASFGSNRPDKVHLPGIFVQDEWSLNRAHKLLLGLRYDHDSRHGTIGSPRLAYKWSPNTNNTLRVNAGTGFRVVNLFTEDHAALTGAREVELVGELTPEQSYNMSMNYVKKFNAPWGLFNVDMSAWYTYFQNKIVPDYETDPNKIIYANLDGHAVSQGVSVNTNMVFPFPLRITAGLTLMDVANVDRDDEGVLRRERQLLTERFTGTWTISYELAKLGLTIDYTGNVYGPMRLPLLGDYDPRAPFSPYWSLQNIQVTQRLGKRSEVYGGVKNLLNFTAPADAIAGADNPFDRGLEFGDGGQVLKTPSNPFALSFDPTYVYAPNQGIRGFLGFRYRIDGK